MLLEEPQEVLPGDPAILRPRDAISTQAARIEPLAHGPGRDLANLRDLAGCKYLLHNRRLHSPCRVRGRGGLPPTSGREPCRHDQAGAPVSRFVPPPAAGGRPRCRGPSNRSNPSPVLYRPGERRSCNPNRDSSFHPSRPGPSAALPVRGRWHRRPDPRIRQRPRALAASVKEGRHRPRPAPSRASRSLPCRSGPDRQD